MYRSLCLMSVEVNLLMLTTSLLLMLSTFCSDAGPENLDFRQPRFAHWTGQGMKPVTLKTASGKSVRGVSSEGWSNGKEDAYLYQTFQVPQNAGTLHVHAWSVTRTGRSDRQVDVYLEIAGNRVLPKQIWNGTELKDTPAILPSSEGKPREYVWSVSELAGRMARIVILDMDHSPKRYVVSSGITLRRTGEFQTEIFTKEMDQLTTKHRLFPLKQYSSPAFITLSNADQKFTRSQVNYCVAFHDLFLRHFRSQGFDVHTPGDGMKIAIFRTQKGYEAALNAPVGSFITGVYQPQRNRLVVYDFGRNQALQQHEEKVRERIRNAKTVNERRVLSAALSRQVEEIRDGTNVSTLMHETAHMMSFNCGLLNREGDVPLWLAEGLACYCEASSDGRWLGIGKKSEQRLKTLKLVFQGKRVLVPLRDLLKDDQWFRGPKASKYGLSGYAQSWALFRMLMEEKPRSLKRYLELIYDRRTPDHRLTDFAEVFGSDLAGLEKQHRAYLKRLVEQR